MDEPSGGTLRFTGHWILTNVFVTQIYILTPLSSILTYVQTSPEKGRSPTYSLLLNTKNITVSADHLVPAIVGAKTLYQ